MAIRTFICFTDDVQIACVYLFLQCQALSGSEGHRVVFSKGMPIRSVPETLQ